MGRSEKLETYEAAVPGGRIKNKKKKSLSRYGTDTYRGSPVTNDDMDLIIRINERRKQLRKKRGVATR